MDVECSNVLIWQHSGTRAVKDTHSLQIYTHIQPRPTSGLPVRPFQEQSLHTTSSNQWIFQCGHFKNSLYIQPCPTSGSSSASISRTVFTYNLVQPTDLAEGPFQEQSLHTTLSNQWIFQCVHFKNSLYIQPCPTNRSSIGAISRMSSCFGYIYSLASRCLLSCIYNTHVTTHASVRLE